MTALTVADLDTLAESEGVEDYPKSGTKAEKIEALEAAGVELPEDKPKADGETYSTRYDANCAYWKLSDDEREDVQVHEDEDSGTYSIGPKGK